MSSVTRTYGVRALKTAACAGVLGLMGSVMVPTAKASLLTLEFVPTNVTNGSFSGQNVVANGSGSVVSFNIVAVLHSTNATQTDDGVDSLMFSAVSDHTNPTSLGTFSLSNVSPFNAAGIARTGTPSGTPAGTDIGPDRVGVTSTDTTDNYQAASNQGATPIFGTQAISGDLAQVVGTGTFTVSGSAGTTTLDPVYHLGPENSSGNPGSTGRNEIFNLDGNAYALNADAHGLENGTTTVQIAGGLDTLSINLAIAPEPSSLALAGLGGLGLLLRRRRK